MIMNRITYRSVGDERIAGTWRPIFIRNGDTYFLTDLFIFADGQIDCWGWTDLDGLREQLASGRIATGAEAGAQAAADHLAMWHFADPQRWLSAENLLGEVADQIDELNGRPDSTGRCLQALDRFLASRSEDDREALRAAYLRMPVTVRRYALGDMDAKDRPLRVLCTPIGERTTYGEIVTGDLHAEAHEYFAARDRWAGTQADRHPGEREDPTVMLHTIHLEPAEVLGVECLRNEYPAPITMGGHTYPTAVHAFWALSTSDENVRAAVRDEPSFVRAERIAGTGTATPGWARLWATAMHRVLRLKFEQHPEFADVLAATGDGRLDYSESGRWGGWTGRLLELVRSEVAARRAGF
ncbi:hypothetical protein Aph02nite_83360 [Actinoplanes philippinensis]|uniref:Predicted NAD-dependent protein-ADP-ribosyltransferase YbiA, DUF1768 family n=1 Tax=Actinoplanes philippinensis TaxID=35752 RepID=A0A1I2L7A4_9ACTN|nr:NADAR family protein [Actinoplanes philippinensis]GIE82386.1 hypothetical protein Aph02nite_83360 [Actinoplanes philippinensis]SFF75212.1 Predicted NAD-dependent protein-ADP-ribosyltransferase YbiA, DUF1768 family [Actinoplanes philippinensis]